MVKETLSEHQKAGGGFYLHEATPPRLHLSACCFWTFERLIREPSCWGPHTCEGVQKQTDEMKCEVNKRGRIR